MEIENAHSPKYTINGNIDLVVKFTKFNFEVPFTAAANDVEAHSVELFNRAVAGEFGTVQPYVEVTE